jgi:hypothetical protein
MDVLDLVKTVGSFVGLITGGFVLIDRVFQHRPIVDLRPEKDPDYLKVVVHNVAKEAILIKSFECEPSSMGVSYSPALEQIVEAAAGKTFSAVIAPGAEMAFVWISHPQWDTLPPTTRTTIEVLVVGGRVSH